MLLLLLCMSTLSLTLVGAQTLLKNGTTYNISSCPIGFFGGEPQTEFTVILPAVGVEGYMLEFPDGTIIEGLKTDSTLSFVIEHNFKGTSLSGLVRKLFDYLPEPDAVCTIILESRDKGLIHVYLLNFGDKFGAYITGTMFPDHRILFRTINVGVIKSLRLPDATSFDTVDLNVCILGNNVAPVRATIVDTTACTKLKCEPYFQFTEETCDDAKECMCGPEHNCAIVGNSVVNMAGKNGFLLYTCGYDIIRKNGNFSVQGLPGLRHLTDTPFIDTVLISTSSETTFISMKQGGVVTVTANGIERAVDLSAGPVKELNSAVTVTSEDYATVAEFTDEDLTSTKVIYDGTRLTVLQTVAEGKTRYSSGICADISPGFSDQIVKEISDPNCENVISDTAGDHINCTKRTTRCTDLLNEVAVPSVNVSPYITACQELLCHYPEVDDLYCHWVRAYADVAKVHDWQEKTSCPENPCAKHSCGSHEFCTVAPSAEASCHCQITDTTINGYRQNGKYGPPPTCGADSRSITLLGCLLEEEGINFHGLHLNNPNCTGEVDQYNNVIFNWDSSNSCGEIFETLSSGFSITQTLQNTQSKTVTFENSFTSNISCVYNMDKLLNTFSLFVADGSIEFSYKVDTIFHLSATLFTDAELVEPLELNTSLSLHQRLWLQVSAPELEESTMTLVIEESWSTTDNDLNGANRYDLIKDGCPVTSDGTVELVSSGQGGEAIFSFDVFQYINATSGPYLHFRVGLCISGNDCVPDCI